MQKRSSRLSFRTQFFYGVGELSVTVPMTLLVFFLLFFLTNVAGLNPTLAGGVLLIGKLWDALNDPLVGWLSDRTNSPWGRRYPWMMLGVIPLALLFGLQWFVPPVGHQWGLFIYYTLVIFALYTAFTAVALPFTALAPELTQDYNERTSLISFKSAFSIGGSLFSLILAQVIFSLVDDSARKFLLLGISASLFIILPVYLCVWGTRRSYRQIQAPPPSDSALSLGQQIRLVLSNRPFLILIGIYLCSWLAVQVTAAVVPYFVINWMGLPERHATQMALAAQGTALLMMFVWSHVAQRWGKKFPYFLGVPIWLIAQLGLFLLQPHQVGLMYVYAVMLGIGIACAYLVPAAMLPDLIELDQLHTQQRREGIFYGFLIQMQKLAIALALFLVGKILDWSGFLVTTPEAALPVQPDSALWAIRFLIGPLPTVALIVGLICTYFYPLTREKHQEILLKLRER